MFPGGEVTILVCFSNWVFVEHRFARVTTLLIGYDQLMKRCGTADWLHTWTAMKWMAELILG
jgi:hypothetical protein